MTQRLHSAIIAVVVLCTIASCCYGGIPRVGRFQGALNRGRPLSMLRNNHFVARSVDEASSTTAAPPLPPVRWFYEQRVDHFNPGDVRRFAQRFFVNDTFFKPNGPIFLLLGGEGPIHATDVTTHFAFSAQAASFNAISVSVEHRFYGESIPLGSTSVANLRLLSSQQALADYAYFIQWMRSSNSSLANSPVVVFGGSYSGNLAAWFRLKYPHLAIGAIASSAPVTAQLDFPEYLVTVSQSLGSSCSTQFANATVQIEQMLNDPSGNGLKTLQQKFNTCDAIVSELDKATFVSTITDEVAGIVQYNNDNNNYESMNIDSLCAIMRNTTKYATPVDAWAAFITQSNAYSNISCTPVSYTKQVMELRVTKPVDTAARSWYWQTCTEFGYYQTAENTDQPFSPRITLKYFLGMCEDVYGLPMRPNTQWINDYYGATNLQGTRIILPNGVVDPWHTLGVLHRANLQETSILMNGTAHVADLYPPRASDPPQLTQTRETEIQAISRWLSIASVPHGAPSS